MIHKIIILALLYALADAKGFQWQKLKPLYKYSANAFHLKESVAVFEIRTYSTYDNFKKYNKPTIEMKYYKTPPNHLNANLLKRFKKIAPMLSKRGNIHRNSSSSPEISNAFTIDNSGKMLLMNEIVDVIRFLGEVDTPAEAQLILWLHNKREGTKYIKTSKGYRILIEYEWSKSLKPSTGAGGIAEFCNMFGKAKDEAVISKSGKLISYRNVWKSKKINRSCIHPEPSVPGEE